MVSRRHRPNGLGLRRGEESPGQGAVVHQPAGSRRRCAHRARVRRAGGRRDQAHQSVRRGDGRHRSPRRTCGRATPTALPPSAASSASTGRSTPTRREIVSTFIEAVHRARRSTRARARSSRRKPNMRVVTADFDGSSADERPVRTSSCGRSSAGCWPRSATGHRGASRWTADRLPDASGGVTKRAADGGGVEGAAVRLAHLRARQVERDRLHRRRRAGVGAGQMSRVDSVRSR